MAELVYEQESYRIMGACFEVYRVQGRGFLESVYQECLEIEFADRGIPSVSQQKLPILYKGRTLGSSTRPTSSVTVESSWRSRPSAA